MFLRSAAKNPKRALYEFDVATGKTRELLTADALLKGGEEKLTPEEKARRERMRVSAGGFADFHPDESGKFLLLPFNGPDNDHILAANPMLAGRFWLTGGRDRGRARTGLRLRLDGDEELRYVDREMLGKLYLHPPDRLDEIPGWSEMGPDADDPGLTLEVFRQRIRRHPGELKPLLRNPRFVAGIGNAYSDEILWEAGLAPFRRRSTLTDNDIERLYSAMRRVLTDAIDRLRTLVPPEIQTQHREFLSVHLRGGQPCPRCGRELRQIGGREATTFCRTCQPPF